MKEAKRLLARRAAGWLLAMGLLAAAVLAIPPKGAAVLSAEGALSAEGERCVPLPVIMYHSVLGDPLQAGPWTISPAQLEEDLHFLGENGYEAVSAGQLIRYVNGEGELPEKPVLITFDDGYYNNMIYALPLLKKYGMRAVISPIGFKAEEFSQVRDQNPMYAYLSWEELCGLREEGTFELGNHSYNLHSTDRGRNGVARNTGESKEKHREILMEDVGRLQLALDAHCGGAPKVFAYPFGKWDKESEAVLLEMGFEVLLTCHERMNYIERDPKSLHRLGRYNRGSGESTWVFMQRALSQ